MTGQKTVAQARDYYGVEFLNARRKQPTPYMDKLNFGAPDRPAADPDEPTLSEAQIAEAQAQGKDGSA